MRVRGSYAEGYKEQNMKTIVMGILAHVDAGKTTLSEAMLYESGVIRSIGRVDKGNTYLERDNQERERGITIFSKQAVLPVHEDKLILLDTPGHVDFSAEAERTLQVLDLAVLVVSAADGVQGHTMTLWKLLSRYHIPVFLFVNKLDQPGTDADAVYKELQERLSGECVDFRLPHGDAFMESVAMCVKTVITGKNRQQEGWQEKVNQIRCYNGEKFELADCVQAGTICTVTGLSQTYIGQGLGVETEQTHPLLEPVMSYRVLPEQENQMNTVIEKLHLLEEEDPLLQVKWNPHTKELTAHVMGPVQIEILERIMKERYDINVTFGKGRILYKETIAPEAQPVEGVGHYEPLRHYAEVHLLLQPGEPGSGFVCDTDCSEDELDRNWQRLVLTHLMEKEYRGVLLGAPVTDIHVTLKSGRAHQKHTEGGDFRQATYRAVRQGLMQADCRILEPFMEFRLELPEEYVGRAMTDLSNAGAVFRNEVERAGYSVLKGRAPMETIGDYGQMVISYTRGQGIWSMTFDGYGPCHNPEEVMEECGYDPERDVYNTADSVFCAHGAGFVVPWYEVPEYMHLPGILSQRRMQEDALAKEIGRRKQTTITTTLGTEEVDAIIDRASGANRRRDKQEAGSVQKPVARTVEAKPYEYRPKERKAEYLLVDGYNVIFAWEELKELAEVNLDSARGQLLDLLCNYQAIDGRELIAVFDAYRLQGHPTECLDYHNIHVVYTKEAETADHYIERFTHEYSKKYQITVVTSDGLEQVIIIGQGCLLISSREFHEIVKKASRETMETFERDEKRERRLTVPFPEIPVRDP